MRRNVSCHVIETTSKRLANVKIFRDTWLSSVKRDALCNLPISLETLPRTLAASMRFSHLFFLELPLILRLCLLVPSPGTLLVLV